MLSGGILDIDFNEQLVVFIPKASCTDIAPKALVSRPLGLKNACPKILADTNCRAFNKVVYKKCVTIQRGGIWGRNFSLIIPELDATARVQAMENRFQG